MRRTATMILLLAGVCAGVAAQQSLVGDVLSGKLVKPKVGQWAWYNLTDNSTGQHFALRQAIVGEESVGRKTGYWMELEIIPPVGYRSIYKMLLTGPASDPKNMHRLLVRTGVAPAQEVPAPAESEEKDKSPQPKRVSIGMEDVATLGGSIRAEHIQVTAGDKVSDVWINDLARPMGIVRMASSEGELVLRNFGEGGEDARSVIDDPAVDGTGGPLPEPKIEVRVDGEATGGGRGGAVPSAPAAEGKRSGE